MTNHFILSQFASFLDPIYCDEPANFYNLTYRYADIVDRKQISQNADSQSVFDNGLYFKHFKSRSDEHMYGNAKLLERASHIQHIMPRNVMVIPCQWDEHANLGQPPAVGSNIAYRYSSFFEDAPMTRAYFLLAFNKRNMNGIKLFDICSKIRHNIAEELFPNCSHLDIPMTSRLDHPVSRVPKRFFDECIQIPMHVVMHDDFMTHAADLGAFISQTTQPPSWWDNLRSLLGVLPDPEPHQQLRL